MVSLIPVCLAVLLASLALAPNTMWGYDPWIMQQVAHSIVTEQSFRVYDDGFGLNLPYSSYGIGMSLLMVVSEFLSPLVSVPTTEISVWINPVVLTALAAVIWVLARRLGATQRQAAAVSLTVALATPLLAYAVTGFSEVATALGVAIGLLGLQMSRDRTFAGGLVAGAGIGLAGLMRPDSFIMVAPVIGIGVVVLARRRILAAAGVAAGAMPAVALTAAYNQLRFGSPIAFQYQGSTLDSSFSADFWTGLHGLTASPGRGILIYAPVIVVMAVGFRWSWQRSPVLTVACVLLVADRLLFYSNWWAWHGGVGWGPRFLVPAMPALAPFLVEVVRRLAQPRVTARVAFGLLVAVSFAVQVVGSMLHPVHSAIVRRADELAAAQAPAAVNASFMEHATTAAAMDAAARPMFEWSLFPVTDNAIRLAAGDHILSEHLALGALFVLALVVALRAGNKPV